MKNRKVVLISMASMFAVALVAVLVFAVCGASKTDVAKKNGRSSNLVSATSVSASSNGTVVYKNDQYGFTFTLPADWKGYTVITDTWQGCDLNGKVTETGPVIFIRNPNWTSENKRQDIPVMLISYDQVASYKSGKLSFESAGIQYIIGNGSKYYFTIPSGYLNSNLPGYDEVEKILNSCCFEFSKENGQLLSPFMLNSAQKLDDGMHIIYNVSNTLKSQYPDINITNEWIGDKCQESRYVVLFGALKSDSQQGVAQVIMHNPDCTKVLNEKRYLDPKKNGTVRVTSVGAKDFYMGVVNDDKSERNFACNQGFDPKS